MEGRDSIHNSRHRRNARSEPVSTHRSRTCPVYQPANQADLRARAVTTIRDVVQPVYVELLKFMRTEYVPAVARRCRQRSAGWREFLPRQRSGSSRRSIWIRLTFTRWAKPKCQAAR